MILYALFYCNTQLKAVSSLIFLPLGDIRCTRIPCDIPGHDLPPQSLLHHDRSARTGPLRTRSSLKRSEDASSKSVHMTSDSEPGQISERAHAVYVALVITAPTKLCDFHMLKTELVSKKLSAITVTKNTKNALILLLCLV